MYCKKCGNKLDDGQQVCLSCGTLAEEVNQSSNNNPAAKSKIAAGLLGIFLGALGIHNFYLGYTGKAVAQLLITILTCGIFSFVSAIWGLIEGILILTGSINVDGYGVELKD
ncbi:MAG: TM2 domain-containing protein [Bacilli bacterium]|nr:TM2 domain-containing protein [Bacilli bacterium]